MNNQELNSLIKKIENQNSFDKAYIGFFYDDNEYLSYIKANKEGLMLHVNQFLKACLEFEENKMNTNIVYEISHDIDLKYSDFKFSRIEYVKKSEINLEKTEEHKQTFKNQVGCFIAIAIGLFALVSLLVGFYTILSSFF
jgi:hypothetical protein